MDELVLCVPADVLASCSACLLRESATACRRLLRGQNLAWLLARMLRALQCAVRASAPGHSRVPAARACLAALATREQTRARRLLSLLADGRGKEHEGRGGERK